MYNYLRKNLRYEKKVHIKKDVLLDKNFEQKLLEEQNAQEKLEIEDTDIHTVCNNNINGIQPDDKTVSDH